MGRHTNLRTIPFMAVSREFRSYIERKEAEDKRNRFRRGDDGETEEWEHVDDGYHGGYWQRKSNR